MGFPIKTIEINKVELSLPHLRKRIKYNTGEIYTLTQEDILQDRGNILPNLADKFYKNPELYTIIMDNNPPIQDYFLTEGFEIFIPNLLRS